MTKLKVLKRENNRSLGRKEIIGLIEVFQTEILLFDVFSRWSENIAAPWIFFLKKYFHFRARQWFWAIECFHFARQNSSILGILWFLGAKIFSFSRSLGLDDRDMTGEVAPSSAAYPSPRRQICHVNFPFFHTFENLWGCHCIGFVSNRWSVRSSPWSSLFPSES